MCGRYTLHTEKEVLARRFELDAEELAELTPRYNVAPTNSVLVVRAHEGLRRAEFMRWGLIPHWAKAGDKRAPLINARAETAASSPAFRAAFKRHRCLILADGFYEWQKPTAPAKRRLPHWISLESGEPFAMAGLWAYNKREDDLLAEAVLSCSILTVDANALVAPIHERMPVILRPAAEAPWIDADLDGKTDELLDLLAPVDASELVARPVGFGVNSVKNDDASLLEPGDDPQLGFF